MQRKHLSDFIPQSFITNSVPIPNRSVEKIASCVIALLIATSASFAQEDEFAGEMVVHLFEEPRHRPVSQDGDLHLLDVRIIPGAVSFPHIHDQAILLTYISLGSGPQNGRVGVNVDYASEPLTHKVRNDGPGMFHIIALVHDGSGNPASSNDQPRGMNLEPEIENNWFRSYRYELAPGESTPMQTHSNPTYVVLGTAGLAHVSREDGITRELSRPGEWAWREADSTYQLTNVGDSPVAIIVNEGRLQN